MSAKPKRYLGSARTQTRQVDPRFRAMDYVPKKGERAALMARLDAEGAVRGKTWRQVQRGSYANLVDVACSWWLWKRGALDLQEERARADAQKDMTEVTELT